MFYRKHNKSKHRHHQSVSYTPPTPHRLLVRLHHTVPHHPFIPPYIFVHVWVNPKYERLLQWRGKADGADQPAHVERHGCSLMWLQLGSPGPNEVLWSPASAPAPIAYTPVAHIQPWLHHSGSLRGCSFVPPGTQEAKTWRAKKKKKKHDTKKNLPIGTHKFG